MVSTGYILFMHIILFISHHNLFLYPCHKDKENDTQRGPVTCPKSNSPWPWCLHQATSSHHGHVHLLTWLRLSQSQWLTEFQIPLKKVKPGITSAPEDPKLSLLTPLAETCHKLLAWAAVRDSKGGVSPASGHHTLSDYRNYSSQIHSLALCSFLPYHAGLLFPLLSVSCSPFTGLTWYHYTKYMEDLPLKITLLPLHSLSALFNVNNDLFW